MSASTVVAAQSFMARVSLANEIISERFRNYLISMKQTRVNYIEAESNASTYARKGTKLINKYLSIKRKSE